MSVRIPVVFTKCYGRFPAIKLTGNFFTVSGNSIIRSGNTKPFRKADIRVKRGEFAIRAQSVSSIFALHALAAQKIPEVRRFPRRSATRKLAIYTACSEDGLVNSQVAGPSRPTLDYHQLARPAHRRLRCVLSLLAGPRSIQTWR